MMMFCFVFFLQFCNSSLAIKLQCQQSCILFDLQNNLKQFIVFAPFSKEICKFSVFNKMISPTGNYLQCTTIYAVTQENLKSDASPPTFSLSNYYPNLWISSRISLASVPFPLSTLQPHSADLSLLWAGEHNRPHTIFLSWIFPHSYLFSLLQPWHFLK